MNFYWIYGVIGVMLLAMLMLNTSEGGSEIQWTEFKQKIEDGQVKRLVFDGQRASVYLKDEVRQSLEEGQDEEGLLKTVYQGADYWLNVPAGDAYLEDLKTMSESYDFTYVYEPVNKIWT